MTTPFMTSCVCSPATVTIPPRGHPNGYQDYIAEGYNVPLDGLQAALVLQKLPHLGAMDGETPSHRRGPGSGLG